MTKCATLPQESTPTLAWSPEGLPSPPSRVTRLCREGQTRPPRARCALAPSTLLRGVHCGRSQAASTVTSLVTGLDRVGWGLVADGV